MTYAVAFTDEFQAFLDKVRDPIAARAIKTRIVRFEAGLFGDVKSVGDKRRQQADIEAAKALAAGLAK